MGMIIDIPFNIGDRLYVDTVTLPTARMEFEDETIPKYLECRVVSVRKNFRGLFVKVSVRANWEHNFLDDETGYDTAFYNVDKYFAYPISAIGKKLFMTQEEADNLAVGGCKMFD